MPTLPTYNSQASFNINTAEPLQNEVEAKFAAQNKVIGAVTDVVQKWSDANDVMEYTKAKTEVSTAIATQKALADKDPDPKNAKAHLDELNKIKNQGLNNISNRMVKQKMAFELDNDVAIAAIEIDSTFKKKQMLMNQINLEQTIRTNAKNKSEAKTSAMSQQIDEETIGLIRANVASGLITEAHGRKLIDDYRLGAVDLDIMNDNATDKTNSFVYDQLKAGDKGIYADLTDKERANRLEKVELHIRRNKIMNGYAVNKNQDETEQELLINHGSQDITEGNIKNLMISTEIRKDFGEKYTKSMFAVPAEETDKETYNKIKMMQLEGKKPKDINNEVLSSIEKLTDADRTKILQSSYDPIDQKTMNIRASAEALHNWASKFDSLVLKGNVSNEVVFNFLQRVESNPNANVDATVMEVQKDYIKRAYPDTSLMQDVPNIIGNRNKIISVYKKESKAGGQKAVIKPVNVVLQNTSIGFDDL